MHSTNHIRIVSYNCESYVKNVEFVRMMLQTCDILLLQETLLVDHSIQLLENVHEDFDYFAVSATRNSTSFVGKSSGGLAVIFRKTLSQYIKPFYYSEVYNKHTIAAKIVIISIKINLAKT